MRANKATLVLAEFTAAELELLTFLGENIPRFAWLREMQQRVSPNPSGFRRIAEKLPGGGLLICAAATALILLAASAPSAAVRTTVSVLRGATGTAEALLPVAAFRCARGGGGGVGSGVN